MESFRFTRTGGVSRFLVLAFLGRVHIFYVASTLKETLMLRVKDGVATFHSLYVFSASGNQRYSRRVDEVPMRYSILHHIAMRGQGTGTTAGRQL